MYSIQVSLLHKRWLRWNKKNATNKTVENNQNNDGEEWSVKVRSQLTWFINASYATIHNLHTS